MGFDKDSNGIGESIEERGKLFTMDEVAVMVGYTTGTVSAFCLQRRVESVEMIVDGRMRRRVTKYGLEQLRLIKAQPRMFKRKVKTSKKDTYSLDYVSELTGIRVPVLKIYCRQGMVPSVGVGDDGNFRISRRGIDVAMDLRTEWYKRNYEPDEVRLEELRSG